MILTQALSAVQLSVEFVTGFFYLFVFSIFSSIIFFLPLKLSSLFRLINWYSLFSNVNSMSSDLFFIQTIIVQRFCSWTSRVIRIKCSLLYMFFSAILEEDRQVPQSSHLFYSHRTTSSFLLFWQFQESFTFPSLPEILTKCTYISIIRWHISICLQFCFPLLWVAF